MGWPSMLRVYAVAAAVFCVLDAIWLGTVANSFYRDQLGDLLAPRANLLAAIAFYAIFLAGLVYFVTRPILHEPGPTPVRTAVRRGAFFGLVTYATWDLTNLAVLADFPLTVALVDMTWGATLSASVAASSVAIARRLGWTTPD